MTAPAAHAKISPSASKTWIACPGQPTVIVGLENRSSIHAERGTLAHSVLEQCLNNGFEAKDFVASTHRKTPTFNTEDADAVQMALDFIRGEIDDKFGDEFDAEVKLKYSDDFWGTADVVRYRPSNQELLIVDYKHGSGVAVDAVDNPQGVSYAIMKIKSLANRGVATVRFVIVQPRGFHELGPIREFVVDGLDMLEWEDKLVAALKDVRQATAERKTSEAGVWWHKWLRSGNHCRWCLNAPHCPRLKDDARIALQTDFAPVATAGGSYDKAALEAAFDLADRLEGWAKAVKELGYAEAERGVRFANRKLVAKRATARWGDPSAVVGAMALEGLTVDDTHEPAELKSPAQLREALAPLMPGKTKTAQKEAAKVVLDRLTVYASSGHTLVPLNDPRPPVKSDAVDDFTAIAAE